MMKRIRISPFFAFCVCALLPAQQCSAAGGAAPGDEFPVQAGGWAEMAVTTSGLSLDAVLKAGGPDEGSGASSFFYTGTFSSPWAKSHSRAYLSQSGPRAALVKVNGHVPPAGSVTWDSETELSYDPPLQISPKEWKVGQEWSDQSSLSGHSRIDWRNPSLPAYDGDLAGTCTVRGRIVGMETVTVPAGRFECYVVEAQRTESYSYAVGWTGGGPASVVTTTTDRSCFSPKLGQSVKSRAATSTVYSSGGKDYPANLGSSLVLVRYHIMRPNEPAGAAARTAPEKAQPSVLASAVDEPNYSVPANPDNFALVIGISSYRDLPTAEFADRDAQAVKRHLVAMGYPDENIIMLTGGHATKGTMEEKLEKWLPMNVSGRSTVFVYYSGHGAPDIGSQTAYLVPWDGEPEALAATAVPLSRFYRDLDALPAKQVLVALDSCFSGAGGRSVLAKGARPLVSQISSVVPEGRKLLVFTASGPDQISGTLETQGHGMFTYYFLKGLNGDASSADRPDHVSVGSLYGYLAHQVNSAAHRQEREQTPQLLPAAAGGSPLELR